MTRWRVTILAALAAGMLSCDLQAATWKTIHSTDSDNFLIYFKLMEARDLYVRDFLRRNNRVGGTVTDAEMNTIRQRFKDDVLLIYAALEKARKVYIDEMGMLEPVGPRTEAGGKRYQNIYFYDFGEEHARVGGVVRTANGTLNLNMRHLLITARRPGGRERFALTVAHELFHTIQHAYDQREDAWLKEATAVWASMEVFPDQFPYQKRQALMMKYSEWPLHYDEREDTGMNRYKMEQGRPYGAVLFFRFLGRHEGNTRTMLKRIWERAKANPGGNGLQAVSVALGDTRTLGDNFRSRFNRYAVGCLLNHQAPPDSLLGDVDKFRTNLSGGGFRMIRTRAIDLTAPYRAHLVSGFSGPDSAGVEIRFGPGGISEDHGRIAGCGFRYFKLSKDIPAVDGATLRVSVPADDQEISLQGMAKLGGSWKVFDGVRDSASGRYVLRIPRFGQTDSNAVYFHIARYTEDESWKTYPIRLHAVEPPVLVGVRARQGAKTVLEMIWEEQRDPSGQLTGRKLRRTGDGKVDPAGGDVEMEFTFNQDLSSSRPPTCKAGGTDVPLAGGADNRTWRGRLPASAFAGSGKVEITVDAVAKHPGSSAEMPLDQDPSTAADVGAGGTGWVYYERTGPGHIFGLGVSDSPVELSQKVSRPDGSIIGELVNKGDRAYAATVVRTAYDASGNQLGRTMGYLGHHVPLAPGERDGFIIAAVRNAEGAVRETLSVECREFELQAPTNAMKLQDVALQRKLAWGFRSGKIDVGYEITATVNNASGVNGYGGFGIGLTLYDDQGRIIDFVRGAQAAAIRDGKTEKLKFAAALAREDFTSMRLSCYIRPGLNAVYEASPGPVGAELRDVKRITEKIRDKEYSYLIGVLANTGKAPLFKPAAVLYFAAPGGGSAVGGSGWVQADSLGAGDFGEFKISLGAERDGREAHGPEIIYTLKP